MNYKLEDIIDIPLIQSILEKFIKLSPFAAGIMDIEGNNLLAVNWQDICTKFHRPHPECYKECMKSDKYILDRILEANPTVSKKCRLGLVDNAFPIIINGEHMGNFFTGQFFLEDPDRVFFEKQAEKYGFDKTEYMEALDRVPVWSQEELKVFTDFNLAIMATLEAQGKQRIQEIESQRSLKAFEKRLKFYTDHAPMAVIEWNSHHRITEWTGEAEKVFGWKREEALGKRVPELGIIYEPDRKIIRDALITIKTRKDRQINRTSRNRRKDKSVINCEWFGTVLKDQEGKMQSVLSMVVDITERTRAEDAIRKHNESLERLNEYALELSSFSLEEDLESFIVKQLKKFANAEATVYTEYNALEQKLVPKKIEAGPKLIRNFYKLVGKGILNIDNSVNNAQYRTIINERIGSRQTLHEISFGAISPEVGAAFQEKTDIDRFIGMSYLIDEDLLGTSIMAMKRDQPDPSMEVLENFQNLTSLALRRRNAELERNNMKNALEELNNQLISEFENERITYSGEIHFQLGQLVTSLIMDAKWLLKKAEADDPEVNRIEKMIEHMVDMTQHIRMISNSLHPAMLSEIGLSAAMEWYLMEFQKNTGIQCRFKLDDISCDNEDIKITLFRILQRSLTNISHHAEAKNVDISIERRNGFLALKINDDGIGMEKVKLKSQKSMGLFSMRERVKAHQGTVRISSQPGKGTSISVSIPCTEKKIEAS